MRKYLTIFTTSWQNILTYRFNFLMGRVRSVIFLLLLYYIWATLSFKTGKFAGYTSLELITYVFAINILRAIIFGSQTRKTSHEINDGTFSKYLCMPVNYPFFVFTRELAEKSLYFIAAVLEVIIFAFVLKAELFFQADLKLLLYFLLSIILAAVLYFIMSFCVSIWAFWSREAFGPRFLFDWFMEFASGVFFPLTILSSGLFLFLISLPFAYILFYPMMIYLGRITELEILKVLGIQVFWIAVLFWLTMLVWKKGLKRYTGEGM